MHNFGYLFESRFLGKIQLKFRIYSDRNLKLKQPKQRIIQNVFQ